MTPVNGLAVVGAIARLLNSGLGYTETLWATAGALRDGLGASRVTLWMRKSNSAQLRGISVPRVAGATPIVLSVADVPAPPPGMLRVPLRHDDEHLGFVDAETDADHTELLTVVADVLAPYAAAVELSEDFASEVALRAREVEEQRRFTGLIIDSLPVGLYVVDRDYRIQVWNRKRETGTQGLRRDAVMGRQIFDVLTRQPREELKQQLDRVFETGEVLQLEMDVQGPDGRRSFRITKLPMRLDGDEITHVITIGEDVTEWRSIQARILQSEKLAAIGQLAAGVMHEINNPLATIGACVAAISGRLSPADLEGDKALGEYLGIIEKEVERCSRIVDGLLDFSRPKGITRAPTDLNQVLEDTLFLLKHHERFKRVTVERHLDPDLPPILANAEQLVQVFMAIMLNGVDAMDGGGRLTVITRRGHRPDEVVAEVRDTGVGISRADLTKIFEPFFTTKPPGRGTGLGLSICYGIIEQHGGRIEADSQPGLGSVFRVTLPVAREAGVARATGGGTP
ncbi:MAG: two-component system sensor histidine kinase NtrB [Gemmatimonadota bacterium]